MPTDSAFACLCITENSERGKDSLNIDDRIFGPTSLVLARASISEPRLTDRAWPLFGRHTRNHLPTVAAVNSEILVGRQDDWVGKRFGHANEASIGEAHGNVGVFLDQLRNGLDVLGKLEGDDDGTAAKQLTETRRAALSEKAV